VGRWIGIALALLAALAVPGTARAGDLTIMFGRGQISDATRSCAPVANSVSLWTIADNLKSRGLTATLPVTDSQIGDGVELCSGGSMYPSWQDLATFRDTYGWSVVPRGMTSDSLKYVTDPDVLNANVCGSRDNLEEHGFSSAWGLFAWPQNRWTLSEEATYVPPCFAFGRKYTNDKGTNALPIRGPYWWANTISINGGRCANAALPCHTMTVKNDRNYMQPAILAATGRLAYGNDWTLFQWYRLVTGTHGTMGKSDSWDCSSPDPAKHWTSQGELYCYDDMQAVINGIDMTRVTVTDPAGVATQQGLAPTEPVH
jgi:hypothetical protein